MGTSSRRSPLSALGPAVTYLEQSEVGKYFRGGVGQFGGDTNAVGGLGGVGWVDRVLQFVASPSEGTEWSQDGSELSPDGLLDRVVAAGFPRAEALLGKQRCACLPRGAAQ